MLVLDRQKTQATGRQKLDLPAPDLSIIIPAYNEVRRLPRSLSAIHSYLAQAPFTAEVIVVDDGSADGTAEHVGALAESYPSLRLLKNGRNYGKGYSVRHGVLQSRGRYVLFTDADLSTPIQEASRLLALLDKGWDVVLGSRSLDPALLKGPQGLVRHSLGQLFHWLVRIIVGVPFKDTQCGFKAFRRSAALQLFQLQTMDGFAFDVEVIWLAQLLGMRCTDTAVIWVNDPDTHVSLLRDAPRMLLDVLKLRWRGWTRTYDRIPYPITDAVQHP